MITNGSKFEKEMRDYAKTLEAVFPSKGADTHNSFAQWRNGVHLVRDLLMQKLKDVNAEKTSIDAEYSVSRAAEKKMAIDSDYNAKCDIARDIARQDLQRVIESKREVFRNAMKAPSDEMLRLLTALTMRESVGSDEISYFAETMAGNLPALRCLADVAKKNDIAFPAILTADDLEECIARSTEAAEKYLQSIGNDKKELSYDEYCFWQTTDPFRESPFMDALDSPGFMRSAVSNDGGDTDALA